MNNILSALLLLGAQIATEVPESNLKSNSITMEKQVAQADSSNYSLKTVEKGIGYTSISFTVVSRENTPDDAIIFLLDEKQKKVSGMMIDKTGKVILYIWDDKIKSIVLTHVGLGKVKIPIEKVRGNLVDIKVQLYPVSSVN